MRLSIGRKKLWLGIAVMAIGASVVTGAFAVSGGGTITTIAGKGSQATGGGFSGDGGPATRAQLHGPHWVAVDGKGNVYISDYLNSRVRKVNPGGTITTFAGIGNKPSAWVEGGPATSAQLSPHGVAADGTGNVYIVEEFDLVRKVSPAGTITTIAGTKDACLLPLDKCIGEGGPATSAQVPGPRGVAVDGKGNIYISTVVDDRVRKVSPTGIISTIAGTGKFGFSGDGGSAISAKLHNPFGVAVDRKGNVYIADNVNNRVRRVSPGGKIITFAGTGKRGSSGDNGPATRARLSSPSGVAADRQGNVYIAEGCCVRKVSLSGIITTIAGTKTYGSSGDGGPARRAQLNGPRGVAVDGRGNVYIADSGNHRVRKVRP